MNATLLKILVLSVLALTAAGCDSVHHSPVPVDTGSGTGSGGGAGGGNSGGGSSGGGGSNPPATTFAVGGTVRGLSGTVVLQNNGGDDLSITRTGLFSTPGTPPAEFSFGTKLAAGAGYGVTIKTQPDEQVCAITGGGSGAVGAANVTEVAVTCKTVLRVRSIDMTLRPGQDLTFCYYFEFENRAPVDIESIRSSVPAFVEDMTVRIGSTPEPPGSLLQRGNCGVSRMLYLTRSRVDGVDHELSFPADDGGGMPLAYPLLANQPAVLQVHAVNTDATGLPARRFHVDLDVTLYPQGTQTNAVGSYQAIITDILVPVAGAGGTATVEGNCPARLSLTNPLPLSFIDLTMVTNRRGTVTGIVDTAAAGTVAGDIAQHLDDVLFSDAGWSSPVTRHAAAAPFFQFNSGKFGYTCSYVNPSNAIIIRGDDPVHDEQCVAFSYFFVPPPFIAPPGQLAKGCLNSSELF